RIEQLFAEQQAIATHGVPYGQLSAPIQKKLRSQVYHNYTKELWIGTFHSLCARILRFDLEKYRDPAGYRWQKNFSIFDESDAQSLVKEIVTKRLNLDEKKFDPKRVRNAIGSAKNRGWSPGGLALNGEGSLLWRKTVSEVYQLYQAQLAGNNALDFDDLIFLPVELFKQDATVLSYWHDRFKHILVDEYQDTNRTQYELIRLLATNNQPVANFNWQQRSVFVVGDADQSIYSFRLADFTILMEFQQTFGDRLPDDQTQTMIKLEHNYRSVAAILAVANHLIEHNTERIDKVLLPTRPEGEKVKIYQADNEITEAQYVVEKLRQTLEQVPTAHFGHFAVLYRTNAQSRPIEDALVRANISYRVVGGLRFYDRKEIKDLLAYLRLLVNPADSVSLLRIINTPRRGIGAATIERLSEAAEALKVPLVEIIQDESTVKTLAGRSAKPVIGFAVLVATWQAKLDTTPAAAIIQGLIAESGYLADLQAQGTDEANDRIANLNELVNAALQYAEEEQDDSLAAFLANAALASNLDDREAEERKVTLMTLHSAKGLEFPVVFLVGLEQGLFPSFRSLNDPMSLEEERRLMYVGITRAQEQLHITYAQERRLYNNRESAVPSQFLAELPRAYLDTKTPGRRTVSLGTKTIGQAASGNWKLGDRVRHQSFGEGKVSNILGTGEKTCLAIHFPGLGKKIIDPRLVKLERLD
ncbi:MAG: 3'-5' exonuclease, partial [Pseudanabaenaceae cyanobacterium bins.68]|nr:3'-5' exonuclease [Pseudanabaenaceae cyanobacterium bins.68]